MYSPTSGLKTFHPRRMWRSREWDLYWIRTMMLRSPELMQLLRAKSMIRYLPPKRTAGLARSAVSGWRRSPRPPDRIMVRRLIMAERLQQLIDILSIATLEFAAAEGRPKEGENPAPMPA